MISLIVELKIEDKWIIYSKENIINPTMEKYLIKSITPVFVNKGIPFNACKRTKSAIKFDNGKYITYFLARELFEWDIIKVFDDKYKRKTHKENLKEIFDIDKKTTKKISENTELCHNCIRYIIYYIDKKF